MRRVKESWQSMTSKIFFGGDVNQIGRQNQKPFEELPILSEADLRVVNLNCVLSAKGQQGIDKGEPAPFYFHARPEQINLLADAQIDVVLTANNHAMDYYATALLEQNDSLDRAGILHCGTGKNFDEAARPLFVKAGDIVVALFNVDATTELFAATKDTPGTFYLPPDKPELWKKFFKGKIADARKKADVVLVAPHWYPNLGAELKKKIRNLAKLLIDCGADAILGCHCAFNHGVETYKKRPIIYNTGNFLFDSSSGIGGAFSLAMSKRGVEEILFLPLPKTLREDHSKKIREQFLSSCRKLNTQAIELGELIKLKFEPPPRAEKILEPVELSTSRDGEIIPPMIEPLPEWTPDKVPDDAAIEPQRFGAVKLIGCRVSSPTKARQILYVETWWTLAEPTDKDLTIRLLGVSAVEDSIINFGAGMEHKACDGMWPTNRWKMGVIYHERFGLRPTNLNELVSDDLFLQVNVLDGEQELGEYLHPTKIEEFKREFKANNGEIFFMLRSVKPNSSGIEHSAFRRAKLFRKYFGTEISFVTNEYQNNLLNDRDELGLDVRVFNMYDYFQEINRDVEKVRKVLIGPMQDGWTIERLERDWRIYRPDGKLLMYCVFSLKDQRLNYVNFFNEEHKKIQRDTYDVLGFLSRRQILEPETSRATEVTYYRPDGTLAIRETYELIKDKNTLTSMELVNREGNVTKTFKTLEDALSYYLLRLLREPKNYFLIGDRTPEWHKAYTAIKAAGLDNVRVLHQLHNIHVLEPFDPFTSKLKPRYRYIQDDRIKSDVIISLTRRQKADIVKRYKLGNVVIIPHSLAAIPKVTDVELNPLKIIQVGRIVKEKGHAKSIEVMKRVLKAVPQATLHFYGKGSMQSTLQKVINENNLGDHIKFEGFSDNMPAVFASAALSILPSTFEGSPLVVQESLRQDCPVVAFDCNYGPADVIEDSVNGYLVPVDDIEAMADRIIKILTEPGLRDKLSANCAKSIERFSPEVVARLWANLFCKLMNNQPLN